MKKGMPLGQIVVPLDLPSQWRHPLVVVLIDHLNPRSLATGARDAQRKAAMFGLGATELAIILVIVVILFGARRLPEIGSGVGKAIKNFKAGVTDSEIDVTPEQESVSDQAAGDGKKSPPSEA